MYICISHHIVLISSHADRNLDCFYNRLFLGYCDGEGNGNPLQYSSLENTMDGGAWQAAVRGVGKSRTRLHFHFSLSCIREGNDNILQCSCLENPRDGANLVGCCLWGHTESETTEDTQQQQQQQQATVNIGAVRWGYRFLFEIIISFPLNMYSRVNIYPEV